MPPYLHYHLIAFLVAVAVVLVSTPIVKKLGIRSGRVDMPGGRKVHKRPMVRLGGVSIFLGTISALLLVWLMGGFGVLPPDKEYEVWGVVIGGLAFFLIGLADDLFCLSPSVRLVLQTVFAIAAWFSGVQIDFLSVPFDGLVGLAPCPR
ncbi:MAG: undecaprenyl/decaprenyl-phosphate alpha-N-acetylglucosaminyl 1-phosphate transferase, partial [Cyanobacteriota bacterium]